MGKTYHQLSVLSCDEELAVAIQRAEITEGVDGVDDPRYRRDDDTVHTTRFPSVCAEPVRAVREEGNDVRVEDVASRRVEHDPHVGHDEHERARAQSDEILHLLRAR